MKRILILSLTLIILVSMLCIPSFASDYLLPEMPPCIHEIENGVCIFCGNECEHFFTTDEYFVDDISLCIKTHCYICDELLNDISDVHTYNNGVCSECGHKCTHAQLDEATYVCVTCGRDLTTSDIVSSDTYITTIDGNEPLLGKFVGLVGGVVMVVSIFYLFISIRRALR